MPETAALPTGSLKGQTMLMSGGSRGIGLAIALRAAQDGANIVLIAKTDTPDPRLPGTIYTAAAAIESAGGQALPLVGDIRDDDVVTSAVGTAVEQFGHIDIAVNNASAIDLRGIGDLPSKKFSLIVDVNIRGTFQLISAAAPHLRMSRQGRLMTLSPPLNTDRRWLAEHSPYTLTKYAMTMLTLGLAEQEPTLSAFCLWPQTLIATAAVQNVVAGEAGMRRSRTPAIMADAAHALLTAPADRTSGHCYLDADVLRASGREDLSQYAAVSGTPDEALEMDLFV